METIKQFNFLDVLILIILFRICYIAVKMGLPIEFFKLMGVLSAIFFSLHYYTKLSDIIQGVFFHKELPLEFLDFLVFIILVAVGYLAFAILRSVLYRFLKMEAVPKINKIGGFILGLIRGYFTIGLFAYMLTISSISYFNRSVETSYLGSKVFSIAPKTYNWLWDNFVSKFSGDGRASSATTAPNETD